MLIPLFQLDELSEKGKKKVLHASLVNDVIVHRPREKLMELDANFVKWGQSIRRGLTLGPFQPCDIDIMLGWLDKGIKRVVIQLSAPLELRSLKEQGRFRRRWLLMFHRV